MNFTAVIYHLSFFTPSALERSICLSTSSSISLAVAFFHLHHPTTYTFFISLSPHTQRFWNALHGGKCRYPFTSLPFLRYYYLVDSGLFSLHLSITRIFLLVGLAELIELLRSDFYNLIFPSLFLASFCFLLFCSFVCICCFSSAFGWWRLLFCKKSEGFCTPCDDGWR